MCFVHSERIRSSVSTEFAFAPFRLEASTFVQTRSTKAALMNARTTSRSSATRLADSDGHTTNRSDAPERVDARSSNSASSSDLAASADRVTACVVTETQHERNGRDFEVYQEVAGAAHVRADAEVPSTDVLDTVDAATRETTLHDDLQRFLQQLNALPEALDAHALTDSALNRNTISTQPGQQSETDEGEDDAIWRVRAWTDRPKRQPTVDDNNVAADDAVPTRITADAGELLCVMPFNGGVYHGQVVPLAIPSATADEQVTLSPDDSLPQQPVSQPASVVPHGFGVWTSADGSCRYGEWLQGEQTGVGTQTLQSVFVYEGEWHNDAPNGTGVGTFADGRVFAGEWVAGRPYGLGSLRSATDDVAGRMQTRSGWFYGSRCLVLTSTSSLEDDSEADDREVDASASTAIAALTQRIAVPRAFADQPLRGLFIVGARLEAWRVTKLQRVLARWCCMCCMQAVAAAQRTRLRAMLVWQHAVAAQQRAVDMHITQRIETRQRDDSALVELVAQSRTRHARVLNVRTFHTQRLATAEFECELAQRCVVAQQDAITLMTRELHAVHELLAEAKQAQAACSTHSRRLQLLKRQIENVSLQINEMRAEREQQQQQQKQQQQQRSDALPAGRSDSRRASQLTSNSAIYVPPPLIAKRGSMDAAASQKRIDGRNQSTCDVVRTGDFVCDAPGCSCGIPRNVFLRVGAALNGET